MTEYINSAPTTEEGSVLNGANRGTLNRPTASSDKSNITLRKH